MTNDSDANGMCRCAYGVGPCPIHPLPLEHDREVFGTVSIERVKEGWVYKIGSSSYLVTRYEHAIDLENAATAIRKHMAEDGMRALQKRRQLRW